MFPRLLSVALALIVVPPALAASVHLRTADGTWVEVETEQQNGAVGFTITPDHTEAGRTVVVVNKPDWMVLEDETPPRVSRYVLGEREGRGDTDILELGGISAEMRSLVIEIADDHNPIDVATARLSLEGARPLELSLLEEDRGQRTARFAVDLSTLGPGAYRGNLDVTDLAPLTNTLSLPLRFSIAGAQISEDRQTITLSGGGAGFTVRGDRRDSIRVDAAGQAAFITLQPEREKHLYVHEFASVADLGEQDGWRVFDVEAVLIELDGDVVTADEVGARLIYRLSVHADIPALVVRSTATNLADRRTMYGFWGWLAAEGYITPDGEHHEWTESYSSAGRPGWVYLPPRGGNETGIGWISDQNFAESRFGTMLLYSVPQKPALDAGESAQMTFAIMPAKDPEEVRAVAERLVQEGVLELPE